MNQSRTPLYDQLVLHTAKEPISLHVPGHKYGIVFNEQKHAYFREFLKLDTTELTGLDDLHSPEGVILEAENLLSQLYSVERSFFLVNGTTVGNLAMMMATLKENDVVLVQRNCHKSVLNGIELTQAKAVFLDPVFHSEWGVTGGVSTGIIQEALNRYSNVKAIILTYPNYYGIANESELEKIIRLAHARCIPVLVDEAHGAHFISGGCFPKSALQLGADIVVQSAHKTLPAMTMGSFLHFNSKLIPVKSVEKYLRILQSSSPSYPIMASLDLARSYLAYYTDEDHVYLADQIQHFKEKLMELDSIKILGYENKGDLLKVTLQTTTIFSGFQMQAAFEKQGIFTELADPYNVLLILPLLKDKRDFPFNQIIEGIDRSLKNVKHKKKMVKIGDYKPTISTLAISHEEMKQSKIRKVSLTDALGEVAAETIIPYPPGIPLLFPGERITLSIIEQIKYLVELGAKFQGSKHVYQSQLHIFTNEK
ncbi:aminotransferase class I/II-fold pyridoxal phosphate-dependent enzyme [Bacillus sp. V3B]|uniref:aminotransferase class I/II-fold pyridoxal phosphate-dependent enzyme n=1 Tax=Bacillus sp. V3B TaxID=2804915 RepID=UPI00210B0382|nr:aminotransferase class I/II-fold pyridoxal phosphate-dependent enzyme [Bacillus sp. V3B]MCQ6276694.1 aminotransferase class I/II-fold pyridoxal phosphate-dependent enzyme [Bacillus sp. V3B]